MKLQKVAGATSEIWQIFIQDSSSTTGAGLTGLTQASSGLTAYYHRDTDTTATAITLVTMTVGTFTSSGFKEIDATNMPGWYQFCPPNAALASGAKSCAFHLKGATNMAPLPIEVQLTKSDVDDGVHFGLTCLPNTAVTTNGSLITSGTGTAQLSVSSGQVILQTGTGTGQLDFTSGVVKCNATQWLGGTIPAVNVTGVPLVDCKYLLGTIFSTPATAGIIDVNLKNIANAAVSTSTAQLGVNVVNFGGSAGTFASGRPEVNTTHIRGTASAGAVGYVGIDWGNVTAQSTSVNLSATTINLVNTATTVTNQLTTAQVATAVWQDATAGDFTVASSIGKALYINNVAPGGSGGHLISGSNSGTTTFGALTVTGSMTLSDGLIVSRSTSNSAAATFTGTGSGNGITITGGAAITTTAAGHGLVLVGGAASTSAGGTSGNAFKATGGAGAASTNGSAAGVVFAAGGTTTVSGNDAMTVTGTGNGNALTLTHAGTGKDFNATTTPLTLAKTTNITGFNDIAATAIVSDGAAITTSNGKISEVILTDTCTTVTNQLTTAQVATAVWTDTTASDFTTALSVGKSIMNGVSLGTGLTVNTATNVTTVNGLAANVITATSINAGAITSAKFAAGAIDAAAIATNAIDADALAADAVTEIWAGSTAPSSATIASAVWDLDATAHQTQGTFGQAIGDPAADTDSIWALVNTNLDTTVSSRMATYAQPTGFLTATFPSGTIANTTNITAGTVTTVSGNVSGNVVGSVGSVTGNVGGNVAGSVASVTAAVAITSNIKKNQALSNFEFMMTDSTNHAPATGKTVTVTRSIDGGAFAAGTLSSVTEISNGMYKVDFAAADLNGNVVVLRATASGCDDTFERITTQP